MSDTHALEHGRRGYSLRRAMLTVAVAIGMSAAMVAGADARTSNPRGLAAPSTAAPSSSGYMFIPLTPSRVLDTRFNVGLTGRLHSRVARTFTVTNRFPGDDTKNVPTSAIGVTGNLTVDNQTSGGYFSIDAGAEQQPDDVDAELPGRQRRPRQRSHVGPRRERSSQHHVRGPLPVLDGRCDLRRHRLLRPRDRRHGPPGSRRSCRSRWRKGRHRCHRCRWREGRHGCHRCRWCRRRRRC